MILIHKETAEIIEYKPVFISLDCVSGIFEMDLRLFSEEYEIPFDDHEDVTNFIHNFEILGWL